MLEKLLPRFADTGVRAWRQGISSPDTGLDNAFECGSGVAALESRAFKHRDPSLFGPQASGGDPESGFISILKSAVKVSWVSTISFQAQRGATYRMDR